MVGHEGSDRLSQPLPLGAALMLLAKCPLVADAFTLKMLSSKQAVTTASNDGIGFSFFVWFCSEPRPWFTRDGHEQLQCCSRWNSWTGTRWWPKLILLPRMFSLICGKLGFDWTSHIIPMRFYLLNWLAYLLCWTVFTIQYLLFAATSIYLLCAILHLALVFAQFKEINNSKCCFLCLTVGHPY